MKKILLTTLLLCVNWLVFAQVQNATFEVTPPVFDVSDEITITVSDIDPSLWGETEIYLWAWYFDLDDNFEGNSPTNGTWTNSSESQKFTNNGDGTFSYTLTPEIFYGDTNIGRMGMLAKAKDASDMGMGERKTQDFLIEVGTFQVTLTSPTAENTIVDAGNNISIEAIASLTANFELFANGASVDTENNITDYTNNYTINEDTFFELVVTNPANNGQITRAFNVILTPNPQNLPVPAGMVDGINWDENNPNTATLVLFAPNKDFVHLIGNFNDSDWRLTNDFLLNKDVAQDRHWITLNNLDSGDADVLFQYLVDAEIKIADPYSTYILSEFDDGFIDTTTFPNIPAYPDTKTEHAISWFNINETAYDWQVTNFERPAEEDLVIYELLIRDFDQLHSYEALMARLDYLENLKINAIELMPVSEFDGNLSWGYNPSFHMALDKYYGNKDSFKAFVDECHARGIAVILDVVYNHATGQNPYYRMWNDCNGCYTGDVTAENPIFNEEDPNTTFQFFNDINHESAATQLYIDRLNEFWLEEYRVDGFRFDFTKGFTNTVGDGGSFDASRIAILQRMYDEIRAVDPTAYVILEHFAPNNEETELIEYRATADPDEPGMMVWSNHNFNYNEATMGYNANSNFSSISYLNRGWDTPSNVGYMESHDEERLNYKNLEFGNGNDDYDVQDLSTALDRLELAGVFYFTIPGPKMIWQFGELGYDFSINYCQDGTINESCRVDPKPIAFDLGYVGNQERQDIYNLWRKLIGIKQLEPIFRTDTFTLDVGDSDGLKRIFLEDMSATGTDVRYVTILGNFGIVEQQITPDFQETGSWFSMIDGSEITVSDTSTPITLQPGEYRIYANEMSILSSPQINSEETILYPNPANSSFRLSIDLDSVIIYDYLGREINGLSNYKSGSEIDLSGLPSGLYLIKVVKEGKESAFKLIKS